MNLRGAILQEAGSRVGGASLAQLQAAAGTDRLELLAELKRLNSRGWISAKPLPDRSVAYCLTVLGQEALVADAVNNG